jgi:hypothetical protein
MSDPHRHQDPICGSSWGRSAPEGYVIWEYTAQGWQLKKDASLPGAMPSKPPRGAGLFIGQLRATPSVSA